MEKLAIIPIVIAGAALFVGGIIHAHPLAFFAGIALAFVARIMYGK